MACAPSLQVLLLSDPPDLKISRQTLAKNYKASSHLGDAIYTATSQMYYMFIQMHNQIVEHSSDITSNDQVTKTFDDQAKLFQLQILRLIERCAAKSLIGALYHSKKSECFFSYAEIPKQCYADIQRIQSKNMLTPLGELEEKSKKIVEQEKINRINQERADKHVKMINDRIEENIIKSPPTSPSSLLKIDRKNFSAQDSNKLNAEVLEKENKQLQKDLLQALDKIEYLENSQTQLRINYFKEINQLREQIFISKVNTKNNFQAIDVRYFDISEGLSPEITKVLNTKLDQMKDSYQAILNQAMIQNKTLEKKFNVFESIHKEGIKFLDMRVDQLVPRLWEVDMIEINEMQDKNIKAAGYEGSKRLWKLLGKYYGEDYFMDIIEDQFGISDEDNEKIERMIRGYIQGNKQIFADKLTKLKDTYEQEIKTMQNELRERNKQINIQRRKVNQVEVLITNELNTKAVKLADESARIQKESSEYEIEHVRKLYEEQAEKNNNPLETHRKMQMKFLFKKWQFFSTIVSIREKNGMVDDDLKARLIEVQHDSKLEGSDPCGKITQHAERSRQLRRDQAMMEYKLSSEIISGKNKDRLISDQADLLQARDDQFDEIKTQVRMDHAGHKNLHDQLHSLKHLTNHQADHIGNLEGRIDREASSLGGGTGRAKLKLLEAKCDHQDIELQMQMGKYLTRLTNGDSKEIWCQTELFGLNDQFGMIVDEKKCPMADSGTQTRNVKVVDAGAQAQATTQVNECQTEMVEFQQSTPLPKSNHQKDSILQDNSNTQKKHARKSEATAHLAPILQGSIASSLNVADPNSIDQTFGLKYQNGTDDGQMEVGEYRVKNQLNEKMEDSLSTNQNETLPRAHQNFQFREEFHQQSQVNLTHKYPAASQEDKGSSRPILRPSKSNISFQPQTMTPRDQKIQMVRESRKSILYQIANNKGQQAGDLEDVLSDEDQMNIIITSQEPTQKTMKLQHQRYNKLRKKMEKLKGTVQDYELIIAKLVKASHQQDLYKYLPTRVPQLVKLLTRKSGRLEVEQLLDTNFYSNEKRPHSDLKKERNASPISGDTKADSYIKLHGERETMKGRMQSARCQPDIQQKRFQKDQSHQKVSNIDTRHSQVISSTLSQEAQNELFGQHRNQNNLTNDQPGLSTSSSVFNNPSRFQQSYHKDTRGLPQMQSQDVKIPNLGGAVAVNTRPAFDTLDAGHTSDGQFEPRQISNERSLKNQEQGFKLNSDVQILSKHIVRYKNNDHPSQSNYSQFDPADTPQNALNAMIPTQNTTINDQDQVVTAGSKLETSGQVEFSRQNTAQIKENQNQVQQAYADNRGGINSINKNFRERSDMNTNFSTQMHHQRQITIQENKVRRSQNYSIRGSQGQMTSLLGPDQVTPSYNMQQTNTLNYPQLTIQTGVPRGQTSMTRNSGLMDFQSSQYNPQAQNQRHIDFYQNKKPPPMDNYAVHLLAADMANIRNSLQINPNQQKRQRLNKKGIPQTYGKTSRRQSSFSKMSASKQSKLAKTQAVRISHGAPSYDHQTIDQRQNIVVLTGDSALEYQGMVNNGSQTTKNKIRGQQVQHPQFLYSTAAKAPEARSRPYRPMSGVAPKSGGVSRYQIQANVPQSTQNANKHSTPFWQNNIKPKEEPIVQTQKRPSEGSEDDDNLEKEQNRRYKTEMVEIDEEQIYIRNDA